MCMKFDPILYSDMIKSVMYVLLVPICLCNKPVVRCYCYKAYALFKHGVHRSMHQGGDIHICCVL